MAPYHVILQIGPPWSALLQCFCFFTECINVSLKTGLHSHDLINKVIGLLKRPKPTNLQLSRQQENNTCSNRETMTSSSSKETLFLLFNNVVPAKQSSWSTVGFQKTFMGLCGKIVSPNQFTLHPLRVVGVVTGDH